MGSLLLLTGPNRSNLQDMLANLQDAEDICPPQPPLTPPSRPTASKVNDHDLGQPDDGNLTEHLLLRLLETEIGFILKLLLC